MSVSKIVVELSISPTPGLKEKMNRLVEMLNRAVERNALESLHGLGQLASVAGVSGAKGSYALSLIQEESYRDRLRASYRFYPGNSSLDLTYCCPSRAMLFDRHTEGLQHKTIQMQPTEPMYSYELPAYGYELPVPEQVEEVAE